MATVDDGKKLTKYYDLDKRWNMINKTGFMNNKDSGDGEIKIIEIRIDDETDNNGDNVPNYFFSVLSLSSDQLGQTIEVEINF